MRRALPKPPLASRNRLRSESQRGFLVRNDLEMIEMDKTAPIHGNDPHSRSRLCKAFLLTVVMLTGIGVEAQAFAKARGLAQSVRKKTATKQVKSYVCPMHPEVR